MTGYQSFIVVSFFVFLSPELPSRDTNSFQNLSTKKRHGACQFGTGFKQSNAFQNEAGLLISEKEAKVLAEWLGHENEEY